LDRLLAAERRQRIFSMLQNRNYKVSELSRELGVSLVTVRRDLQELANEGLIKKVHGGAVALRGTRGELSFHIRQDEHAPEKRAIGKLAASLVNDGETLAIDAGTTTLEAARHLVGKRISVVTSSVVVALELARCEAHDVFMLAGRVRVPEYSTVGHLAEISMSQFRVDKAFIAIAGLSLENGLTDHDDQDAGVKKQMIKAARQVILLADHSKFERVGFCYIGPIDQVHVVITDRGAPQEVCAELIKRGIQVLIADPQE